jgi:hypothetical protein
MNEGSHSVAFLTHQLERFDEADMADLPCRRLGHEQVLVLGRSLQDAPGLIVRYALIPVDGPTDGFFDRNGTEPW